MKPRRVRFDIRRQGMPILGALLVLILANILGWGLLVRPKASEHFERTSAGGGEKQKELREYGDSVSVAEAYVTGLARRPRTGTTCAPRCCPRVRIDWSRSSRN